MAKVMVTSFRGLHVMSAFTLCMMEVLSVVQLEGPDDTSIHGWSCDVVLAVKGDLCVLQTLDLSIVDPVHRSVVHEQQHLSSLRVSVRIELFEQ